MRRGRRPHRRTPAEAPEPAAAATDEAAAPGQPWKLAECVGETRTVANEACSLKENDVWLEETLVGTRQHGEHME